MVVTYAKLKNKPNVTTESRNDIAISRKCIFSLQSIFYKYWVFLICTSHLKNASIVSSLILADTVQITIVLLTTVTNYDS
jgi:hypothetical protein